MLFPCRSILFSCTPLWYGLDFLWSLLSTALAGLDCDWLSLPACRALVDLWSNIFVVTFSPCLARSLSRNSSVCFLLLRESDSGCHKEIRNRFASLHQPDI